MGVIPIFRPFLNPTGALGDVYVEHYRRLNDQDGRTVLARFSGAGNALTEQTVGRGRLLLFASDLDNRWNRFPLNPAFVPWAVETARYLTQGRGRRELRCQMCRRMHRWPRGDRSVPVQPRARKVQEVKPGRRAQAERVRQGGY